MKKTSAILLGMPLVIAAAAEGGKWPRNVKGAK